jgi:hypothetical protein
MPTCPVLSSTIGQSQFSALLELAPKSDRIQTALAFARKNHKYLRVGMLAEAAHLSPRQVRLLGCHASRKRVAYFTNSSGY